MKLSAIRVLVSGVVAMGAFSGAWAQQEATGAGASFPAPLYSKWAADYNKATGVKINYQSVGSGAACVRSRPRRLISALPMRP